MHCIALYLINIMIFIPNTTATRIMPWQHVNPKLKDIYSDMTIFSHSSPPLFSPLPGHAQCFVSVFPWRTCIIVNCIMCYYRRYFDLPVVC